MHGYLKIFLYFFIILSIAGCSLKDEPAIINRYGEVFLTNKNELQFRFKINPKVFTDEKMYKIKVQIHDDLLAEAIGNREIIYGDKEVYNGISLNVSQDKQSFIYMDPIPLLIDLHVFDIKKMITKQQAVSVEIISQKKVIAKTFLTNFTSQL